MGEGGRLCPGLCHWRWPGRFAGRLVVIMTDREIMQQALEAMRDAAFDEEGYTMNADLAEAHDALRERLAQPEQEPVAWMVWGDNNVPSLTFTKPADKYVFDSLYTTPPQRKPLTDEQIDELSRTMVKGNKSANWLCRAIEAAHGIFKDEK